MAASLTLLFCLASAALLTAAPTAEPGPPGCEKGWTQFNSRCFKFYKEAKYWMDGEKACHDVDANLASIHSLEENDFLVTLIMKESGSIVSTWIGGTDAVVEKKWLWSDGTPWDYENWHSSEPNNAGIGEHTLAINYGDKKWGDFPQSSLRYFMCAKDVPPPPPKLVSLTLEGFVCKSTEE